jgi:hypothetical protein
VGSATLLGWMRNNRVRVHYNLDEVRIKTSKFGRLGSIVLSFYSMKMIELIFYIFIISTG